VVAGGDVFTVYDSTSIKSTLMSEYLIELNKPRRLVFLSSWPRLFKRDVETSFRSAPLVLTNHIQPLVLTEPVGFEFERHRGDAPEKLHGARNARKVGRVGTGGASWDEV